MEQTLERGEKHLEFLKSLCRQAFPEFGYRGHLLDHERDLFVMAFEAPDGRRKNVCWTRMVLFDAERLPALIGDPRSPLGVKLLNFLRARSARSEIVVTFRHLEEGWVETPEPRRGKRRRRGGRLEPRGGRREQRASVSPAASGRSAPPLRREPHPAHAPPSPQAGEAPGPLAKRRRRFRRRRRRGRGPGSETSGPAPSKTP